MPYIRNKRTGETIFVPDEQPQSAPTGVPIGPQDPTMGLKMPQAKATIDKTNADISNTNAGTNRTVVQTQGDVLSNTDKQRTLSQNPISDRDQALINSMRLSQGDLAGVLQDIQGAQSAVDRFQPAPGKGTDYAASVPDDSDGWWSANVAKPFNGWWNGVTPQGSEDYQTLAGLQNQSVLNSQIAQKGPQTESDAVRMKLAGVSPNKDVGPNAQLLAEQQYRTMMSMNRPGFYETWANNLGSTHKPNTAGKTSDQVWNEQYQRGLEQMRNSPGYRRAAGRKGLLGSSTRNLPKKPAGGARFLGFED